MISLSEKTWELNVAINEDNIFAILSSFFETSLSSPVTSTLTFLDDFDFHLWKANHLFYKTDNQQFKLLDPTGKLTEIRASDDARFSWDFPEGKNTLQKLIGLRALMPVTNLQFVERFYSLCNEDQKIVVKATFTQLVLEKTTVNYLTLRALRGYKKYYNRAEKALNDVAKIEVDNFGLKFILANYAIDVFELNKESEIVIDADMPAEESVRTMASGLLNAAQLHVKGTIDDVDTEFLHQFRVNFRKLRSLIGLLKKSLPPATVETLKPKLSSIAGKTNKLRDLDVFLLDEDKYRELLPDNFDSGLAELYTLIRKQRKEEQKKVASYFSSQNYVNDIAICAEELSASPVYETDVASKPVLRVAKKLLLNRYHKMLAISADINSQSADDDIHELRIEFKKFRYLIEFFIDLLPKKNINPLLGDIKKIQTVLGDFNDYSTQIIFLKNYLDDDRIEMSKALSGLIAVLHQKQVEEKRKVNDTLASFFTEKMTNKIDAVFGSTIKGGSE